MSEREKLQSIVCPRENQIQLPYVFFFQLSVLLLIIL